MFVDSQTLMWNAASLTSTAVSDGVYDLGAPFTSGGTQPDPSVGIPIGLELTVSVAADHTTGNETYEFDIITATASDLTTGQKIIAQYAILYSALTLGAHYFLPVPQALVDQRYLGAKYIGGGTTPTITVTGFFTTADMSQKTKNYSTAIVIK